MWDQAIDNSLIYTNHKWIYVYLGLIGSNDFVNEW